MDEINYPEEHVRDAPRQGLPPLAWKSTDPMLLPDKEWEDEDTMDINALTTLRPFSLGIACELRSLTSATCTKMCLSALSAPSPIAQITDSFSPLAKALTETALAHGRFRLSMLSKALQTQAVEHLKCMTHRAQDLRISCDGSSVGFVTPTTWQQCVFTAESTHDAYTDAEDDGVPCAVLHVVPLSRADMAVRTCAEGRT